jgi:CGNR zinc finger/Putative stress-induced transcription regulator
MWPMRRFRETGILAIDLVNTLDPYLAEPERLPDADELRRFLGEYGIDTPVNRHDLQRCKALRGRLLHVLTAPTAAVVVARLNTLIAEGVTGAEVVARADGRWVLALTARPRLRLDKRLMAAAVDELVELVSTVGPERIRACGAAPCREIFVDTSRNGRRRYCSRRCANRLNANRHRHRERRPASPARRSELQGSAGVV